MSQVILLCFSYDLGCVSRASAGSILGEISSPTHQSSADSPFVNYRVSMCMKTIPGVVQCLNL